MRSPILLNLSQPSGAKIDICVASPHHFFTEHQHELLPDQNVSYLILVLQQSSVSLKDSNATVAVEKNRLRSIFIRFGCSIISSLENLGFDSDLFDPRTGYPLMTTPGITLDDNAVVQALLGYPLIDQNNCSLIVHPDWKDCVYPATIATNAPLNAIESCLARVVEDRQWRSNRG